MKLFVFTNSVAEIVQRQMVGWLLDKEYERMWKSVGQLNWGTVLSLPGDERSSRGLRVCCSSLGRNLNIEFSECEIGLLPTWTLLLLLLLLLFTICVQRIYKYITEVHHVFSACNVTAILWLQYTVHVMPFSVCNVTAILWLQCTVHVMPFSVCNVTAILWLQYTVHVMLFSVCNDTAILWLQYTVHVMLFPTTNVSHLYISTFRSMCAVPSVAVFCSSLTSCYPGVSFR
jgi:hypothetical protein